MDFTKKENWVSCNLCGEEFKKNNRETCYNCACAMEREKERVEKINSYMKGKK